MMVDEGRTETLVLDERVLELIMEINLPISLAERERKLG